MRNNAFIEYVKYLFQALGVGVVTLSIILIPYIERFNDYLTLKNGNESCGVRLDEIHRYTVLTRENAEGTDWSLTLYTSSGSCTGVFKIKTLLDATLDDLGDRTVASQKLDLKL